VPEQVLSPRALNRALLERQGLLERGGASVLETVERLVGMQAQVPENPYVALWSRLEGFRPEALSELIEERELVRAGLWRSTLHLVSARDCVAIHPLTLPVLAKTFRSPFGSGLNGADLDAVVAAGIDLLGDAPRTRAQLSALLSERWPEADPSSLAYAVTLNAPLVQTTPRGLWRQTGQATWAPAERWLGAELDAEPSVDALVLRYLAAFGPASVADIRTWSGLTGLREVVARLRPQLRSFRDENGKELVDVADGVFADPDTPAPVRFLPEYDNLLLSHADRSRVLCGLGPGLPYPTGKWIGQLLLDGFFRSYWEIIEDDGVATLTIDRLTPSPGDPPDAVDEITAEGERLLAFVAPEAGERRVRFEPSP
jgi:Winged helix DNA-binding domain